jgi:hypothetical protein
MFKPTFFGVAAVAACLVATSVAAQNPDPNANLPASTRLALPGERHTWMAPLVGDWKIEMRVYPGPGAQPIVADTLTARRELILGGRYLREELTGTFGGAPSSRLAILGYNNLDGRFELTTFDTFEPGQMVYLGDDEPTAERFSMEGESTEAGLGATPTGRKRDLRFEFEIAPERSVERIYVRYPGEAEFLFVEQIFTR